VIDTAPEANTHVRIVMLDIPVFAGSDTTIITMVEE
jgi:hypothetical protein